MPHPRIISATYRTIIAALTATALLGSMASSALAQQAAEACVITKTDTNPFFVNIRNAAIEEGRKLNITVSAHAGREDGDTAAQVDAVEACILAGAKGILITPSDDRAIVPVLQQARDAGILVLAIDTPVSPYDAVDGTFATDNFNAGILIGQWAKAKLGADADKARIAFLDVHNSQVIVDVNRSQGFMHGFGIDIGNRAIIGDENDPRIVGHDITLGNEEGGRRAMENLLQIDPSLNVVYTVNEPAAAGAYEALKAVGREKDVIMVSVDGGCQGVRNIAEGSLMATAQQYPSRMAQMGIQALRHWLDSGEKPVLAAGQEFIDTGVSLVTDQPLEGLDSISSQQGLERCWGN